MNNGSGASRTVVILGMLVGAAIAVKTIGSWPTIVLGALVGYLVSSRLIRTGSPSHDGIARGRFPAGLVGFILSAGSWAGVILTAHWVATRPPGTFNDQGGMIITFAVLPLMLMCWTLYVNYELMLTAGRFKLPTAQ